MMKVFKYLSFIICLVVMNSLLLGQNYRGFLDDLETARIEAGNVSQILLVNVYSKTCFSSKQLEQEVYRSKEFGPYTDEFVCVMIDIDSEDGIFLKDKYAISGCPTILFIDGEGKDLERITSYIPKDFLIGELHRILEGRSIWSVEKSYGGEQNYGDAFLLALYYCRNDYHKEKLDLYYKEVKRFDPQYQKDSSHVLIRYILDKELNRGVGTAAGEIKEYTYLFPDQNNYRLAILLTNYYLKVGDKEEAWSYFSDFYLLTNQKTRVEQFYLELKLKTGH